MAQKAGRYGVRREDFDGDPSRGKIKGGKPTAADFTDSEEIVFSADTETGKPTANIAQPISNKIINSLQLPASPPAVDKVVAIGTNGAQKLIDVPGGGGSEEVNVNLAGSDSFNLSVLCNPGIGEVEIYEFDLLAQYSMTDASAWIKANPYSESQSTIIAQVGSTSDPNVLSGRIAVYRIDSNTMGYTIYYSGVNSRMVEGGTVARSTPLSLQFHGEITGPGLAHSIVTHRTANLNS